MIYEKIRYEVSDAIATLTLDRADKLNAYTPQMGDEIVDAFSRARQDANVRVVILTGAGRAFCAGVDLDHFRAHMAGEDTGPGPKLGEEEFVRSWPLELVAYPKPVIVAINGPAYGVGVTMTLGADVRLAAKSAVLGLNFAKLGVLPGLGSTHLLPQLVGVAKALELVLSAATLTADEAHDIGLVQRVVADDALADEARALARAIAELRPEVLAAAKHAVRFGATATLADAMSEERALSSGLNKRRTE
jgi:2-(1,2-epoxy-1,2-dihydrophenyl)acetyl-CoA isomerase